MLTVAADAEAQTDHLLLSRRKRLENIVRLIAHVGVDDGVRGRPHPSPRPTGVSSETGCDSSQIDLYL